MIWSAIALIASMLAYGLAGAQLHKGSRSDEGALRSRQWWMGTGAQGAGFLLAAISRRTLPLMLVQAVSAGGLAVTAIIQHLNGDRRLRPVDGAAILGVVGGLGLVATGTMPSPATAITSQHLWALAICVILCAGFLVVRVWPPVAGLIGGLGFAAGAVGARLVMGDPIHPFWDLLHWPLATWGCAALTGVAIILGQWNLTRGLASAHATPVLAPAFVMETLFPSVVGLLMMGESPRPGSGLASGAGLLLVAAGMIQLLRPLPEPGQATTQTIGSTP